MSRDHIFRGCREMCHRHSVGMEIMLGGPQNAIRHLEGDQGVLSLRQSSSEKGSHHAWRSQCGEFVVVSLNRDTGHYSTVPRHSRRL